MEHHSHSSCQTEDEDKYKSLDYGPFASFANLYKGIPFISIFNVVISILIVGIFCFCRQFAFKEAKEKLLSRKECSGFLSFPPQCLSQIRRFKTFQDWLKSIFLSSFEDIENVAGKDAVLYLRFQKCCIVFMVIVSLFSLIIILPLNLVGEHLGEVS